MPVHKYDSLDEAFRGLTDAEIEDDESNYPVATIRVPGLHVIKIKQLSEYNYYYVLNPMREKFLNYYLNKFASEKQVKNLSHLTEKIKNFVNEISNVNKAEDVERKSKTLGYLFEEEKIRKEFFINLKKMGIIKWWVTWNRYQKHIRPIDTLTIFCFLWAFNFDGVKKKTLIILEKIKLIFQDTSSLSVTDWNSSEKMEKYAEMIAAGKKRVDALLANSRN